jgi:hypothetical protein
MPSAGSKPHKGASGLAIAEGRARREGRSLALAGSRFQRADIEDCQAAAKSAMIAQLPSEDD